MRTFIFGLVSATAAGALVLAQQSIPADQPLRFRAGTDIVQVDVSVLDSKRAPVNGLVAADFTVFENGVLRPIEAFTAIALPDRVTLVDAAWTRDVTPDVATNQAGESEGRIVVVVMDRTIPVGPPTATARRVAAAAFEGLGPGDLGALVSTSGGIPQNLTSDRARLLRAINQRDWSTGGSAEAREIEQSLSAEMPFDSSAIFTPLTDPRCLCGLCVHHTITNVATALEAMPRRRKVLLFIGSRFIIQVGPQAQQAEIGCGQKVKDSRGVMFAALDRSGVIVHSVDPTGLQVVGPIAQASSNIRGVQGRGAFATAVQENLAAQGTLGVLPDRTGGRVVMNTNAPEARVPEILRESQSYYVLGFRPSEPAVPGQSRTIEVKVNRRDARVSTRRGYVVPARESPVKAGPDARAAALRDAMASTLPGAAVPLALHAAAFAGLAGAQSVAAVSLDVSALAPEQVPGASGADVVPLDVAIGAYDSSGRPQASARQTLTLSWPPNQPTTARRVEVLSKLDLPPGEYEIRAAVSTTDTSRPASVFTHLTVPAFASVPLSLSHIVIAAGRSTSAVPSGILAPILPVNPTTGRHFSRTEGATAFLRIYQGTGRQEPLAPVELRAKILDARNQVVIAQAVLFKTSEFRTNREADCRITLPISTLVPGEYLLSVEAGMGERVAGRAIRFSVL